MEERTVNYPGYRDESTMKVIRHESLGIYIYAKPKNQMEQKCNLNLTARAEAIRCRRFEAIVNERYDFFDKEKMKGDFLAYFKKLTLIICSNSTNLLLRIRHCRMRMIH